MSDENHPLHPSHPPPAGPMSPGYESAPPPPPPPGDEERRPTSFGVLVGMGVGLLISGAAVAITVFVGKSKPPADESSASPPASTLPPSSAEGSTSQAPAAPSGPWMTLLHAEACPEECVGGAACKVTPANADGQQCLSGAPSCNQCVSGVKCIAGSPHAQLAGEEKWSLHLSAIWERRKSVAASAKPGKAAGLLDPCAGVRDLWLCMRPKGSGEFACASQREACANKARSVGSIPVTSHDLLTGGVDVEIREGGSSGKAIDQRQDAHYGAGLLRRAVCGGFKLPVSNEGAVSHATFFLLPR